MTRFRLFVAMTIALLSAACGGNEPKAIDCAANLKYQDRVEGKKVVAPEGLDQLNALAEMPIPRADPDAPKLPEGTCADRPPIIGAGDK